MRNIKAKWHKSIKEIPMQAWDDLLNKNTEPFFYWKWLNALETSKSVSAFTGWQPIFLVLEEGSWPIAAAPLYLKSHSYGEFVYDQQFVRLAHQLGLKYYPKIVGMSPFSPIEGYRFFFRNGVNEKELTFLMIKIIDQFATNNKILSSNFLYVDKDWQTMAEAANCNTWINEKSLWESSGENNFSDYLKKFNANQRRNIKRERNSLKNKGIKINIIQDEKINKRELSKMYYFYEQHCLKWGVWGSKYLSSKFFEEIANTELKNQIIIFSAKKVGSDETIAMSLCVKNENTLWGRYWGAKVEIDFLHFELCYYSPIEWAIENGIRFFDPGAGGGHKRRRGFLAQPYASLHRWYSPEMNAIIKEWLPKVNDLMMNEIISTNNGLPLKTNRPLLT